MSYSLHLFIIFNMVNLKVKHGWKPGAISKRLLKILNKAKLRTSVVEEKKLTKRTKKRTENKPLIIIGKTNGDYQIEMQMTPDVNEHEQYTPLIYKIESANNNAKIKKREKLQKRLTRAAVKNVWSDPYHPDKCENVCLKSYYEAMGIIIPERNYDNKEELESCSCDDEEISSSCDSSEIDWEIQFSPPIAAYLRSRPSDVDEPCTSIVV